MRITDIKIEVVRRELPETGLDSDLGRFSGETEQGVLRVFTDEGIEGNCAYYEHWMPAAAHQFGLVEDISLNERKVIEAPTGPGLGYELDWEWIAAHRVATLE